MSKESKKDKEERETKEREDHTASHLLRLSPSDVAHSEAAGVALPDVLPGEKIASVIAFGESSPFHKELSEDDDVDMDSYKSGKRTVSGPDGSDVASSAAEAGVETSTSVVVAKDEQREEQRVEDSEDSERVAKAGG